MGSPSNNRSSGHPLELLRHYLCPTDEEPHRRRRIVRDGEVLIGPSAEALDGLKVSEVEALRAETVLAGEGVEADAEALQWRARVSGFGYLHEDDGGKLEIRPAIQISEDHLRATIELHPPAGDEEPLAREELDAAIIAAGIVHGLSASRLSAVWKLFESSGNLPGPVPIASGTPPVTASVAGIDFFVEGRRSVGQVDEAIDQIDFHEQNLVVNVFRHQELGRWHEGGESKPGRGVDGVELDCDEVAEDAPLRVGEGVETREQEDGSVLLLSGGQGMLVLSDDGIPSVTSLLELPEDVGLTTGNIVASGSVIIGGAVRPGFQVEATADIVVRGTVEGADLRAGGQITIEAGLIGEGRTKVVAAGNVTLKYSQNACVVSGGDVQIQGSETASQIECRGDLVATEGKGRLQGGRYYAGGNVTALELGSELGVPTFVSAGRDPLREFELKKIRLAIRELTAEERKQRRSKGPGSAPGNGPRTKRKPRMSAKAAMDFTRRRQFLSRRLAKIQEQPEGCDDPRIVAQATAYYGLDVAIGSKTRHIEETMTRCRFVIDPETGEIEAQVL